MEESFSLWQNGPSAREALMKKGVERRKAMFWSAAILTLAVLAAGVMVPAGRSQAAPQATKEKPYTVEYYYKVRWGHQQEFLKLFRKNHLPLLKKLQEAGRITEIEIEAPRYHAPEEGRWDFRVSIEWKNFAASADNSGEQALIRQLFPDQDTFQKEEQRRFEILEAHWDLPVVDVPLEP
jgi:hypothetical protein